MDILAIPGHIANATNRVNILASSNIASLTFYKNGKLNIKGGGWIILSCLAGVIIGVFLATNLDGDQFKVFFKYLLIPIFILLVTNPKKFINANTSEPASSKWVMAPLLFLVGIYAGFIQVGFGLLFLMIVVMLGKYNLISGNALKITIVAIYSIFVVAIFQWKGMIQWVPGLVMAIGQSVGGFVAAQYMSKFENANKWAYRVILIIITLVLIKNFNVVEWLIDFF